MLAIAFALTKFHYCLKGRKSSLFTDHRALTFLFTQKQPSIVMAGWQDTILEFDFGVVYRCGVLNVLPDHVSRFPSSPQTAVHTTAYPIPTSAPHHPLEPEPDTRPPEDITVCYMHLLQDDDLNRTRAEVPEGKRQVVLANTHHMGHPGGHKMVKAIQHAELPGDHIAIDLAGPQG